jgi:hypothetical protein
MGVDGPEISQALVDIKAISHHELGRYVKPDIAEIDLGALLAILDQ